MYSWGRNPLWELSNCLILHALLLVGQEKNILKLSLVVLNDCAFQTYIEKNRIEFCSDLQKLHLLCARGFCGRYLNPGLSNNPCFVVSHDSLCGNLINLCSIFFSWLDLDSVSSNPKSSTYFVPIGFVVGADENLNS
jgi:hypothetical protein